MNFLLDENFPKSAVTLLAESGHTVVNASSSTPRGIDDARLFAEAQVHKAILLTTDRDFYHTVPLKYTDHFGAIVIALKLPNREAILARLSWIIAQSLIFNMHNTVVLVRDNTYRVRHK